MLEGMTHAQFDEWCAKDQIEPIGSMQAICSSIAKLGAIVSAFAGHEMKESYFMPWVPPKKTAAILTAKESGRVLTAHLQMLAGGH